MADTHTYKFNVTMSCGGCSGAINRVLGKLEGAFVFVLLLILSLSLFLSLFQALLPP
jgi:copper chaperone CopZ